MPKSVMAYNDFRGGWNPDTATDVMQDNELQVADNVVLDIRGTASKRKGTIPFNETSYEAEVERLFEWPRKDGTVILVALIGTTLSKINDTGVREDIVALDEPDFGHFIFRDKLYVTGRKDDEDKLWEYDGTTLKTVTPNAEEDNDLTPIKRCRLFLWHPQSHRIFASGDREDKSALYFSEYDDPSYFKASSKLYPATAEGIVTGLQAFSNGVIAFYQRGAWVWQGVDPATDSRWHKLPLEFAAMSQRTISMTPGSLSFVGQGGIYTISPGLLDYNIAVLTGAELVANLAQNKVTSVIKGITNPQNVVSMYDLHNNKLCIAYSDNESERNNNILVYDWLLHSYTRHTGLQVNDMCQLGSGEILLASKNYILKFGTGYEDFDVETGLKKPVEFTMRTKQFQMGALYQQKKLNRILLAVKEATEDDSTVDVTITADYASMTIENIPLYEGFAWGSPWGGVWGHSWNDYIVKEIVSRLKGQHFSVQFVNANNEPFMAYGVAFVYKALKPKGVRVNA